MHVYNLLKEREKERERESKRERARERGREQAREREERERGVGEREVKQRAVPMFLGLDSC